MPGCPRCEIIDESEPGVYHCFNRCARQAFLMGQDLVGGTNYDYRKDWLRELLIELAGIFGIDILKYSLMDNHLHLILRNRPDLVRKWSKQKVLRRAMQLCPVAFRRRGWLVQPNEPLPRHLLDDEKFIEMWRTRLASISWLMKIVQERIARRANNEDKITGVFWNGRFKSERLLDDSALLACSLYIDLNPIRAKKADRPEESKHTSVYDRIRGEKARRDKRKQDGIQQDGWLSPLNVKGDYEDEDLMALDIRASNDGIFEMSLEKYLEILDAVGRELRADKRGAIADHLAPILERMGLRPEFVVECVETYGQWARLAVGAEQKMRQAAERIGRKWLHGLSKACHFFTAPAAS